jgi:hypothetical protein
MSDIVERLRASLSYDIPARYPEMVTEAADEIERLRKNRWPEMAGRLKGENEVLMLQNKRLKVALMSIAAYCSSDGTILGAIERLAAIRNKAEQALK